MTWRVGRKVGRTVYDGDTLIGVMDTPALAARVVEAVNASAAAPPAAPPTTGEAPATFDHLPPGAFIPGVGGTTGEASDAFDRALAAAKADDAKGPRRTELVREGARSYEVTTREAPGVCEGCLGDRWYVDYTGGARRRCPRCGGTGRAPGGTGS